MIKRNKIGQFIRGSSSPRKGIYKARITNKCIICGKVYHTYHKANYTCSSKCRNESPRHRINALNHLSLARKIRSKRARRKYETRFGYVYVFRPKHKLSDKRGYICEHRLIMEKHIGRRLKKNEVIHHKNGNKKDNSLNNLILFPNHSAHMKYHWTLMRPL